VTAEASATEESAGTGATAATAGATRVRVARHARRPSWPVSVVRTARPRQWPKNLLVFAAPLAGATWGRAHGVYFINDVADAERDRRHPRKRYRPVAAGNLPKSHALAIGAMCAVIGLAAGVVLSVPLLTAAVGGYMGMSFLYSWVLKHIAVVELVFVASGFLLRVLGGAAATHVPPSAWFLLVCSLGALGVATAKRYTELAGLGDAAIEHRPAMRRYRPKALLVTQWVIGALMIAAYLAWAAGERHSAEVWHILSAIPLAAALVRFAVLTARHTSAPVEDLLMRDGIMLGCELSWLALFVTGLQV